MKRLGLVFCVACCLAAGEQRFAERDASGFALAVPGVELVFPEDHGSHPEFKTEWWYVTGHLEGEGRELGFQLTFFRSAEEPGGSQVYMAHAAVSDKRAKRFWHEERLNSDKWNADAAEGTLDAYNGNWYLRMTDPASEAMVARFSLKGVGELQLELLPRKGKTLFGDAGYSRKGDAVGAASYYATFTRLGVRATLRDGDGESELRGVAWMDHEFSSSQLTAEQVGWNWTSAILDDGSELMAYVMRREDGAVDPNSRLTVIGADGGLREFKGEAFAWEPIRYWESPETGGVYPVEYEVRWPGGALRVVPEFDGQELVGRIGGFAYWEGAGTALAEDGRELGKVYTELTGYAESLYGKF